MGRTKVDWRSASKDNYLDFCKKHPNIDLSFDQWKDVIYRFNDHFSNYILETGDKVALPYGFGDFSINKKKRKRKIVAPDGKEFINLPIDWQETRKKGKRIYRMNYHTDGYFFGWHWFKKSARFKQPKLWYFKPVRAVSRLVNHYVTTDPKYQHLYKEWVK